MSAKDTTTDAPVRRKMKGRNKALLIVFSLLAMAFLRTGFVFLIIAMLPSIVAYYYDQSEARYRFKTIFYCNFSGVMPFLGQMLVHGPSSSTLHDIMGSLSTWVIIYGAACMGGILISITPMVAQGFINSVHNTQISRLQRSQKKIETEWGKEVGQFGKQHEMED